MIRASLKSLLARRVRLLLSGDAVVQGELLANPVAFSVEKEVVLVGAPMP